MVAAVPVNLLRKGASSPLTASQTRATERSMGGQMRAQTRTILAFLAISVGCGQSTTTVPPAASDERPTGIASPSIDPPTVGSSGETDEPSGMPSPSATAGPSGEPIGIVRFSFAEREMTVTIVGQPGIVVAWRGASDRELAAAVWDESEDIGLGRLSDRELVLAWSGTVCDLEATLIVAAGSLVVWPPPREGCDAMAVGRGMILTYAAPVDPVDIDVRLMDTVLLPEPS